MADGDTQDPLQQNLDSAAGLRGLDFSDPEAVAAFFAQYDQPEAITGVLGVPTEDFIESTGLETPYTTESPYRVLQGMSPEQFARMQDRLVNLGLIDPTSIVRGQFTVSDGTVPALTSVLTYANNSGQTVTEALDTLEEQVRTEGMLPGSLAAEEARQAGRMFTLPDTASLKSRVRYTFQESLGRDPTQAEMRMFTDQLMADYQSRTDVEMQGYEDVGAGRVTQAQEVDPVARFRESFYEHSRAEVRQNQMQESAGLSLRNAGVLADATEREALK